MTAKEPAHRMDKNAVGAAALTFVASFALVSCASESVGSPAPAPVDWRAFDAHPTHAAARGTPPTPKERAIAEAYASAIASPQIEAVLTPRLAPDAHFAFPGVADVRGKDAVLHAHALVFGSFADRRVALTRVLRTDATQIVEWTFSGTQTADWMGVGVGATKKPVTFTGAAVLSTQDDGTLSDIYVTFDVAAVKAQLGAGPKELASLVPPPWPTANPVVAEQSGSPVELQNVALAKRWLDALDGGDRDAYLACFADDLEVTTPEASAPARGREAAATYYTALHREIAQLDARLEAVFGIGAYVAVEYSLTGEQIAPIGWVPLERDRVVRLHFVDVLESRDGRITRVARYANLAEAAAPNP